jgi:hypothetical protein
VEISAEDTTRICVFAGLGVLLYFLTRQMSHDQPRFGPSQNVNAEIDFTTYMGGPKSDHFVAPADHQNGVITLPIRFPHRAGHEISCVIHEGWSAMSKSAPQDSDWMYAPPSEVSL